MFALANECKCDKRIISTLLFPYSLSPKCVSGAVHLFVIRKYGDYLIILLVNMAKTVEKKIFVVNYILFTVIDNFSG